ncbi:MAG: sigma-70 family RNA polymerase sigma factor [Lachnospiraceae bacterium]|nr:sigma-70 family RNA polymerase sigma factor [Lachnospiraceae bacterium]MCI9284186.1 sigma-70 family RNA polymerase sigma factor [Lachnospiraceae bacterium]
MKLTIQEQEIVWRKFRSYCIKVIDGEVLNYLDELKKQQEHEICFSDLSTEQQNQLYTCDDILKSTHFQVMNMDVEVNDDEISEALGQLSEKRRMIILMTYFLDMRGAEIAQCMKLVQSTIHYHKAESLRLLKEFLE